MNSEKRKTILNHQKNTVQICTTTKTTNAMGQYHFGPGNNEF